MGQMFSTMAQYFIQDDWPLTQVEGKPVLRTEYTSANGNFPCTAFINEPLGLFSFYIKLPVTVPRNKFAVMAEFIVRANNQATIGRFLLDWDKGELGFRQTIEVDDPDEFTISMVKNAVMACYSQADMRFAGVKAILNEDASPEIALEIPNT